jgi:hypothetical protein
MRFSNFNLENDYPCKIGREGGFRGDLREEYGKDDQKD